jgi:hypothetical protein
MSKDDDDDDDDDVTMAHEDAPPTIPKKLAAKLLESHLPNAVYQLFNQLADWYSGTAHGELPATVRESMSDLLGKAAVSLGHCCLANLPKWQDAADAVAVWWSVLKRAAAAAPAATVDATLQEAITSTMVVALRSRLGVRTQIGAINLDDLPALLAAAAAAAASSTSHPVVARDVQPAYGKRVIFSLSITTLRLRSLLQ